MRALKHLDVHCLADTATLLAEGGDARIAIKSGRNEYGCTVLPDPGLLEFGSSTASTISEAAFDAADALRERLNEGADCKGEFDRIRREFSERCELDGNTVLFAPSGTDVHLIASQLTAPHLVVMAQASETGRGVPDALSRRHFSSGQAHGKRPVKGVPLADGALTALSCIDVRDAQGHPIDSDRIDEEFAESVALGLAGGKKVLLVLTDVSKTGMIVPSIACALRLKAQYGETLEVLVDACQFRMAPSTLNAYLQKGFMVAVTGSKFLTGPTFSGALVIPGCVGLKRPNAELVLYASSHEWQGDPGVGDNVGLLLRWEAAMTELRAFQSVPAFEVARFLQDFSKAVTARLEEDPRFVPIAVPEIDRSALCPAASWDNIQTIFPFRLNMKGKMLEMHEAKIVHEMLRQDLSALSSHEAASMRCTLGQPVASGALRICSSARLVVEGVKKGNAAIDRALAALDKLAVALDLGQLSERK